MKSGSPTRLAAARLMDRGGRQRVVNVVDGEAVCATLTARYGCMGLTNILSMSHFPMSAVLYEY